MVLDFQVANCVTGASLHAILEPVNPLKGAIFEYVLVNGQVTFVSSNMCIMVLAINRKSFSF